MFTEEAEIVDTPPGLTDDSEPEADKEKLVEADSDDEEQEMEEWLAKLGMEKKAGGEVVIVKKEAKEEEETKTSGFMAVLKKKRHQAHSAFFQKP